MKHSSEVATQYSHEQSWIEDEIECEIVEIRGRVGGRIVSLVLSDN